MSGTKGKSGIYKRTEYHKSKQRDVLIGFQKGHHIGVGNNLKGGHTKIIRYKIIK